MILDHPSLFMARLQPASDGPGIPFVKVTPGPSRIAIVTEACLDGPGPGHLQVGLFEFIKLLREEFIEMLFVNQPGIPGACQSLTSQVYLVPTKRRSPDSLSALFSWRRTLSTVSLRCWLI